MRTAIYGARTGDRLGVFDDATGQLEDIQGRTAQVPDLDAAIAKMREWCWAC